MTKKECKENEDNDKIYKKEEFITRCPYCGSVLEESETGKSVRCPNLESCPGVTAARMSNMLGKLDFKKFSYESIVKLKISSLTDLFKVTKDQLIASGIVGQFAENFIDQINILLSKKIKDSKIIGALGFSNIAIGKWDKILQQLSLEDLILMDKSELQDKLVKTKSIGRLTAETIVNERDRFIDDLKLIYSMPNVIRSSKFKKSIKVRFSGVRSKELSDLLESKMCDVSDGSVTKDTNYLIVPYKGFTSTKTKKANDYGVTMVSIDEFSKNLNKYLK